MYYQASIKRSLANIFIETIDKEPLGVDAIILCYKGMASMIKAKYAYNPHNKLFYFAKGKELLEKSVSNDFENIEIRFMRFCIQTKAPFFLGYRSSIATDKEFILKRWSLISDIELKTNIKNYLLGLNNCSEQEKILLK